MTAAGGTVIDYLEQQRATVSERESDVLADAPDAVHRSRVATRRARSVLRTFAPLFKAKAVAQLRAELAWHADHLGAPRDTEVLAERLSDALAGLPADKVSRSARDRLLGELAAAHDQAHARLVASMGTQRYRDLRSGFDAFVSKPPVRRADASQGEAALALLLDKAMRRVVDLSARAEDLPTDLTHWHEVRKAAKAARYCSEALVPAFGESAEALAKAWEAVTEALGEVQDTVVAEGLLVRLAAAAHEAGEPVETYLDLVSVELANRHQAFDRARSALVAAVALAAAWHATT